MAELTPLDQLADAADKIFSQPTISENLMEPAENRTLLQLEKIIKDLQRQI